VNPGFHRLAELEVLDEVAQDEPQVLAVAHQSRSPHYWRDRS
jgi:hypothetical protein